MRIINTARDNPAILDTMGRLAFYSGMDNLTLFEIHEGLTGLMTPAKLATYRFEMELQAPLLEMSFNGIHVNILERTKMTKEFKGIVANLTKLLNEMLEAIGYFTYYHRMAIHEFSILSGIAISDLPSTWDEWKAQPIAWRREVKLVAGETPLKVYHKALKETCFNPNSPAQKLKLFYHFFGIDSNLIAEPYFYKPPWLKTYGIKEHKGRKTDGTYGPTADRSALEKVIKNGHKGEAYASYWGSFFAKICLDISDLTKSLGFLKCQLENGMFRASFGAVTETGRLSSRANAMGYGSNAQNVTPKLRHIFTTLPGYKLAAPDYGQIESRIVAAICFQLFGLKNYIAGTESGDLHSLAASMVWDELPWPEDFNIKWSIEHGAFPSDMLKAAKKIASEPFYRGKSRRDLSKTLGHGCLTEGHEVLTPEGWVDISTKPITLMQVGGTFVSPSNWVDKAYTGPFVEWEGLSISAQMTAEHRVYYTTVSNGTLSIRPAHRVPKSARILLGKDYTGGNIAEKYARLLAAYHCDGHWRGYNQTEFHFHKKRKITRLTKLANEAGITITKRADVTKVILNWIPKIHEPTWAMLDWTKESLGAYMDELKHWDGWTNGTYVELSSTKRDWLEKWQTFNRLLGKGGNISKPKISGFGSVVYVLQENNRVFASRPSFTVDKITNMTAQVYCPTVPKKAFYIRRNGKISITGNTSYMGKPQQMAIQSHIDKKLVEHYQDVFFEVFPEIRQWHNWVTEQVQTTGEITTMLGRTRRFFGRPTDDATIREAVAFEPQSVAADYTNQAMLRIYHASRKDLPLKLFLQKHDELGFRFLEKDEARVCAEVQKLMEKEIILTAPDGETRSWFVPTEFETGWNLGFKTPANPDGLSHPDSSRVRTPPTDWKKWNIS